jgi:hypothetical protein
MKSIGLCLSKRGGLLQLFGIGLCLALSWGVLGRSGGHAANSNAKTLNENADSKQLGIPRFKQIELLKVNGKVLGDKDKITFGSPEFTDWDGDSRIDLILGYWASWSLGPRRGAGDGGKVRFFRNISKTDVPEYRDMGDLECDGGLVRLAEA